MKPRRPLKKTKKQTRRTRKKTLIIFGLLLFIVIDVLWIINHDRFKIVDVHILGNSSVQTEQIQDLSSQYLSSKILWLFPRDNVFFTHTRAVARRIENAFPKIYNADVLIKNGSDLYIHVEEREPHSLWCEQIDFDSMFEEHCYFADQKGYIYARAPYFSEGVFEKIYTNEVLEIGTEVLDKKDFDDFFVFLNFLYLDYEILVDKIVMNEDGVFIYIHSLLGFSFEENPYIVYNPDSDYGTVQRNIGLMIKNKSFAKKFKSNPKDLRLIDVRIEDQIRYIFTPEQTEHEKRDVQNTQNNND